MKQGTSWRELGEDGAWWEGVASEALCLIERAYGVASETDVLDMARNWRGWDLLCECAIARSYLQDGYLTWDLDAEGGRVMRPSEPFLRACKLSWPDGPWPEGDPRPSPELTMAVATLAAATSCAHARMDMDWADEHFNERMMVGEEDQREVWRFAMAHEPLLEHAPEDVRDEAARRARHDRMFDEAVSRQHDEWVREHGREPTLEEVVGMPLPSAPDASEVIGQAVKSATSAVEGQAEASGSHGLGKALRA